MRAAKVMCASGMDGRTAVIAEHQIDRVASFEGAFKEKVDAGHQSIRVTPRMALPPACAGCPCCPAA